MKAKALNYRVIVKKDKRVGTGKPCFSVFCPTLGVADDGNTFEEALANIQKLISFHLECLAREKEEIPTDEPDKEIITTASVELPRVAVCA